MDTTLESRSERRRGLLRLATFVVVVLGASALWVAQRASAELGARALFVGRELAPIAEHAGEGSTALRLNGQAFALHSASTELSVGAVLDRFERLCARDSGGTAAELAALAADGKLPEGLMVERFGVLRSESEREGNAACFARERGGLAALYDAAVKLGETGDSSGFGQLRYLFVRDSSRSGTRHIVTVTSDGPLRLLDMLPGAGDAPGSDLVAGVRPPDAERSLSAEGGGYGLVAYESKRAALDALAGYGAGLLAQGYERLALPAVPTPLAAEEPVTHVYARGNDRLILFAAEREDEAGSLVSGMRIVRPGYTHGEDG
jgi:hypothetical protein